MSWKTFPRPMRASTILLGIGLLVMPASSLPASEDIEAARSHWAFQPVEAPALPEVRQEDWIQDDLDRFILARLESEGLEPAPRADRRTLLRRTGLVLTGLPPDPDRLQVYLEDPEPDSDVMARYVDELLESEEFGVHWGRHWLDHVRYRPARGKNLANDPYRLWVVRSLNGDLPLDRFLRLQIAGDLIPTPEDRVPLEGLVAVRPFTIKKRPHEQVDLLGRTFLGLSLACARCHDHAHEPLTRRDYYALEGIFTSSEVTPVPRLEERDRFRAYLEGLARKQASETRLKKELKAFASVSRLRDTRERLERERQKLEAAGSDRDRAKLRKSVEKIEKDEQKHLADLRKRELSLDDPGAVEYLRLVDEIRAFDQEWKGVDQFEALVDHHDPAKILDAAPPKLGAPVKVGEDPPREEPVPRRFPAVLAGLGQEPLSRQTRQSGRLELARWLTSPDHPITARLLVNRIWYHVHGEGITPSLSNLGLSGQPPGHPALLDHLAHDLWQGGASLKRLVRRLVLSSTFQQVSHLEASADELDRRRELFGRARSRRLLAESIWRALERSGRDPQQDGRPRPPSVEMVREIEALFDGADADLIVPRRSASVTELQALFLLNSDHVRASTEKIARRLLRISDLEERVERIYLELFSRSPTPADLDLARAFLRDRDVSVAPTKKGRKPSDPDPEELSRWQAYTQALLCSNEFLFFD